MKNLIEQHYKYFSFVKNHDDTYKATTFLEYKPKNDEEFITREIVFPRVDIVWKENIEFGEVQAAHVLSENQSENCDKGIWTLTLPDKD